VTDIVKIGRVSYEFRNLPLGLGVALIVKLFTRLELSL
jgi:hypothetical protein